MAFNKIIRTPVTVGAILAYREHELRVAHHAQLNVTIAPTVRRGRFIAPIADLSALARCSDVRINSSMCIIASNTHHPEPPHRVTLSRLTMSP
jgi:hypothetical protein